MYIAFSTYPVFGSGFHYITLTIDGTKVTSDLCREKGWMLTYEDNGFVCCFLVDIPVEVLRKTRELIYESSFCPGGDYTFKGTGKRYLKGNKYRFGKDPLLENSRTRVARLSLMRWDRKWGRMIEWAKKNNFYREENGGHEWRENFLLPDGCKGGRWVRMQPATIPWPDNI